jgi:uncharacterized protein
MKRFISAVLLSAAVAMPTMAQKQKTLGNGYPFTQVPFTCPGLGPTSLTTQSA